MLAAMLPDCMTKPKTDLHCADSAVIVPVQAVAHATETSQMLPKAMLQLQG